ncbi:proline racemase family protein [Rubripirellula reticaptiva]|nr:proline racemase family protein [Rubripirellula reticaptiva]
MNPMQIIRVVDSHTEGEPTRVVVDGAPSLRGDDVRQKRDWLKANHDWLRTACLNEPRGNEAMVGALLCDSNLDDCVAGVIFFNNVGYLNSCIHGTIGLAQTLAHLGKIGVGDHGIETPVGRVTATVHGDGTISVRNVRSYRFATDINVVVPGFGHVHGDVAWGGNWFFLVRSSVPFPVQIENIAQLSAFTLAIRTALTAQAIRGEDDGEIDHIEIADDAAGLAHADSKNFVLCPGNAYDRSPCGTGTSAKLACLFADGKLSPGQTWRQAGILETVFLGTIETASLGGVVPTIAGRAFINGETNLIIDPLDPFRFGIPSHSTVNSSSIKC